VTAEGFGKVAAVLHEVYGVEFSDEKAQIWLAVLSDVSDAEAERATLLVCRMSSYPPKPADLLRVLRGTPADAELLLDEEAEAAVRHLEAGLSDYEPIDLGQELNVLVRLMGGPDAIVTEIASGQWRFRREEARRVYKRLRREGIPFGMVSLPEWPEKPRRVETIADVPVVQQRVFAARAIPGLPAPAPRPTLPEGER